MVGGLPAELDAAVLVVLHIPPGAPSALSNILARSGSLPATTAQDGERIVPGHIYVAPSDRHLLVRARRIALSSGPAENGHRPAVDPLFRSAARYHGPQVIGVILSGARDDGTAGLAAVVERGGTAIVQDPDTALHRSMPCAAMEHLAIEHVLPPAQIARLVAELVRRDGADLHRPADDPLAETITVAALGTVADDRLSDRPVGLSCPSCHGAMFELDGAPSPRYRCRVGHAWSPESLLIAQRESVDATLWTALRALEEWALLCRQLATVSGPRDGAAFVDRHTARVDVIDAAAEQVRRVLARIGYRE